MNTLHQTHFDIACTPMARLSASGRIKSYCVHSILQLVAVIEFLKGSLQGEKCLLIVEGLSPLILAQKVFERLLHCMSQNTDILSCDRLFLEVYHPLL